METKQRFLNQTIYHINIKHVLRCLAENNVENVSIFIDKHDHYEFFDYVCVSELETIISNIEDVILIYDGRITQCLMDKEIESLTGRKILIEIDAPENTMHIVRCVDK